MYNIIPQYTYTYYVLYFIYIHLPYVDMRFSQKKSSACGFSQSQLLGTLHSPVHQHHAELDLVGMHQGAAGNGITSGWESSAGDCPSFAGEKFWKYPKKFWMCWRSPANCTENLKLEAGKDMQFGQLGTWKLKVKPQATGCRPLVFLWLITRTRKYANLQQLGIFCYILF